MLLNILAILLAASSVLAHNHPNNRSHVRRSRNISIARRQSPASQQGDGSTGLFGSGLGGVLGGLNGSGSSDTTSTQPTSVSSQNGDDALVPTTSSSSTPDPPPAVSPSPSSGGDNGLVGGLLGGVLGGGGGSSTPPPSPTTSILDPVSVSPSDVPTTSATDPTITPPPTSTGGGLLGPLDPLLGGVTSGLSGVVDPLTSAVAPIITPVTSAVAPVLNPVTSIVASDVVSPVASVASPVLSPLTSAASVVLAPVTSDILPPVTSVLSSVVQPVTSVLSSVVEPITSDVLPPVTSILSSVVQPITSDVLPPVTSVLSSVVQPITSVVVGPISTVVSSVAGPVSSIFSSVIDQPSYSTSILPPVSTDAPAPTPISSLPSMPISTASPTPTISFPVPADNATLSDSTSSTDAQAPGTTVTATTVTTVSIAAGLSFVLTESSLAFTSVPTDTPQVETLTNPDEVPSSVSSIPQTTATTIIAPPPLPTGIPGRIYPRDQLDLSSQNLAGYTLISLMFNSELNWEFVVDSSLTSSQIFAYVPVLIENALGITADQIKTYALQVSIPASYHSAADAQDLLTSWLGYIRSDEVDSLAAQIKAKTSAFYTTAPPGVAQQLAERIIPGVSLLSVADPNANPGSGPGLTGNGNSSGGNSSTSRQDAIIGVVSALGAIALLVLVFLVYRSMKRRRQLAHHRLSDPPDDVIGARPEGRQFDEDSVGGARRRSFYYAEDSLRVYEGHQRNDQPTQEARTSPTSMTQRRVPLEAISAPVLKGSTMNW